VSAGIGYDSSPVNKDRAPIYFPVSDQLRMALGASYRYSHALVLRSSLSVVKQSEVNIGQDSYPVQLPGMPAVTGKIEGSRIYMGAVSVDYRF
jgi:long-subunit fatty acid transport protein